MDVLLHKSVISNNHQINISGSKSESNRLLILQALYPNTQIENLSNADDTHALNAALTQDLDEVNIHHAGTAMRFLTAYYAILEGKEVVLSGSKRMHQRPIKVLVDALSHIGAEIEYANEVGFPPLKIKGKSLSKSKVEIDANVSSQYITALLLIAAKLENGLEITLNGRITSLPYINMTLALLQSVGITAQFNGNVLKVYPFASDETETKTLVVESDWSSASYFYSMVALSDIGTTLSLTSFKENSLQGDAKLVDIYREFGVESSFDNEKLVLNKTSENPLHKTFNLIETPDLAQTIAVTCFGLGIGCKLEGLHTLKIKETDRLVALKIELEKLGAEVAITSDQLELKASININSNVAIDTYQDHRMAMAFAPLALRTSLQINEANVVSKSYPNFWNDLKQLGVLLNDL